LSKGGCWRKGSLSFGEEESFSKIAPLILRGARGVMKESPDFKSELVKN
jgi:hypothetical protein